MAYVAQETYLFQESLRYNLTLGATVTERELAEVSRIFFLEELVERLDQGWETLLSDKERQLSGGEKQRIALARAYLSQKPILLIDEGTSAIDSVRAREIENFLLQTPQKTVFFVSHHMDEERHPLFEDVLQFG